MWPQIIKLLKESGFSQQTLAERVGVDQSTICRLGDGRAPEPRYSVGTRLIEMAGGCDVLKVKYGIDVLAFVTNGDANASNPPSSVRPPAAQGV